MVHNDIQHNDTQYSDHNNEGRYAELNTFYCLAECHHAEYLIFISILNVIFLSGSYLIAMLSVIIVGGVVSHPFYCMLSVIMLSAIMLNI